MDDFYKNTFLNKGEINYFSPSYFELKEEIGELDRDFKFQNKKIHNNMKVIFNGDTVEWLLEALDIYIDEDGFAYNTRLKEHTLDVDGNKFKPEQLIGIVKKYFITNDSQLTKIILENGNI